MPYGLDLLNFLTSWQRPRKRTYGHEKLSLSEHRGIDLCIDERDPFGGNAKPTGVLEQHLGIWRFVFAIRLALGFRDIALDPHDAGHGIGHLDRPFCQML